MEPHSLPQTTWQLQTSQTDYLTTTIPWWQDISPAVLAELQLEDIETLSNPEADIIVIGAGVAGLSAALSAQEAGTQVLLLEATSGLGRGATGRNAGILSAGVNMGIADLDPHGPEARFWPETTSALLKLVEEAGEPESLLQAHLTGAFSLAESANAARTLAREVKARTALGTRAELWSAAEVAQHTDGRLNTSKVVQAMWLPDEGRIQPLTLLAHLARQARQAGVRMFGNAQVVRYRETAEAGWQIALANGMSLTTAGLITAVGPTSQPDARIYALAFEADLPEHFPLFWDASPYTYMDYRAGCGRLTISGGRYGKKGGGKQEERYFERLAAGARYWLPELAKHRPRYQWSVDLAVSANMVPELRVIGSHAPALAIEGLGALGVLPGIVLGQRGGTLLAQHVGHAMVTKSQQRGA